MKEVEKAQTWIGSWKYSPKESGLLLPYVMGRIEVATTGLGGLFCVCLLCKESRDLHSWDPIGVLHHPKVWHQDGDPAQHKFRAEINCLFSSCPNHSC